MPLNSRSHSLAIGLSSHSLTAKDGSTPTIGADCLPTLSHDEPIPAFLKRGTC